MTPRLLLGLRVAALAWACLGLAYAPLAQSSPSAQEIIDRLAPPAARADEPARAAAAGEAPPAPEAAAPAASGSDQAIERRRRNLMPVQRRIDLNIPFEFNGAVLRAESQGPLMELAQAMRSERLRSVRFLIEGHTDAKGSADYNERLSELRARSVASFLVRQGVEPQRLQTVGKGMRELLPGEDPLSPANRRVRIIALD